MKIENICAFTCGFLAMLSWNNLHDIGVSSTFVAAAIIIVAMPHD